MLATPKLARDSLFDGVAMSRSMNSIPNQFVQDQLAGLNGLDGEFQASRSKFDIPEDIKGRI